MLIKTISTKQIYNNELLIYCKYNHQRIDKNFVITKTSRVCQLIEIDKYEIYNQKE